MLSYHTGRVRPSELPPWRAVALSRHRVGCWVPLSRWRVQKHTGPGGPPDSRPRIPGGSRLPQPARLFLGAEHSPMSSRAPTSNSSLAEHSESLER